MPLESVAIKDYVDFLSIKDGNNIYYGGNQEWFTEEISKKYGCAAVSASNLLAFLRLEKNKESLYPYPDFNKDNFLEYMREVIKWVKPREKVGVLNPKEFIKGVCDFGKSRGLAIEYKAIYFNVSFYKFCSFIKDALEDNKPIAILMLRNEALKEFDWHWMTITKFSRYGNKLSINVSTWGEKRILDLEKVYKHSSYGALVCFDIR